MKCTCKECNGTGSVTCEECDGFGEVEFKIAQAFIDPKHKEFKELQMLKQDAARLEKQTLELIRLNPGRRESYQSQFEVCMHELDRQADALLNPKGKKAA